MDADCVFCRIANGIAPADIVYEDDRFISFLSIDQKTPGHSVVIPKEHFRWFYDVPETGEYFEVVKKIALATKRALSADSVSILTLGFEIPHSHVWVIPRKEGDGHGANIDFSLHARMSHAKRKEIARKIRECL